MLQPATQSANIQEIQFILARASDDIEFRELLLTQPEEALKDSSLSAEEKSVVANLKKVQLEEWGIDVRRFRAAVSDNGFRMDM
ncbi:hypothetical protein [Pseudomonas chlororaphis]|uniref:hypothetical protein n=1 Tax=Pseudomonas chlororaphis TaxID=587753 RepID=UPI001B3133D4|nr:hypothetical protein [Pseudomonas chlororaphis]MBP5076638.1 hypothetical protein [Pseudomonas chlororaphis]QTT88294.1 hypothetical protein HUT28_13215 [Pseudomonas chlororaphis]